MNVQQPVEMLAPSAAYTVFYALFAVNALAAVAWLVWRARAGSSPLPLAALGGGLAVGFVFPPIYNALTLVWFPSNIPVPFITAFGMKDPLFDLLGYALFMGFGGWALCEALRSGHGARAIWLSFVAWGVVDLLLELPFLDWGLYTYYGDQPLTIGGFPLYWVFMNGAVPVIAGVLMYAATVHWPFGGPHAAWRVAAAPAIAGGLLLVPMAPVAVALHADVGSWVRVAAALLCAAISLATVQWIASRFRAGVAGETSATAAQAPSLVPTA